MSIGNGHAGDFHCYVSNDVKHAVELAAINDGGRYASTNDGEVSEDIQVPRGSIILASSSYGQSVGAGR